MKLEYFGVSDVGCVRDNNEDGWLARNLTQDQWLLLVADGVGGRDAGEVASATVVEVFDQLAASGKLNAASNAELAPALLSQAVQKAHVSVARAAEAAAQKASMSCTLSVALVSGSRVNIVQVGDSRVYHWRDGELRQLTLDQTVAMQLLQDGRITPEQVPGHPDRNTLFQSIGLEASGSPLEPAHTECELQAGDRLLLCSDGLTDMLNDADISALLAQTEVVDDAAEALVQAALAAGGRDNVTVVVALAG